MVPEAREVLATRRETADTVTLTLAGPAADGPWPEPAGPGQFLMLSTFGVGEVPISVSGLDRPGGAVEHTIRDVGAVTAALVAATEGDVIGARGPFGKGWDLDAAAGRDVVVLAGGIGLAPLRPLIEGLLAQRHRFGAVSVLVGARTPADLCFTDDMQVWANRGDVHVGVTVDRLVGHGAATFTGSVGVVTTLIDRAPFDGASAAAFVCGPEVMMRFGARALVDRGVDPAAIAVSAERSMTCGIGHCGHCQMGPLLICRDGPVVAADAFAQLVAVKER